MNQDDKGLFIENIPPKETEVKKPVEGQKETTEIKPEEKKPIAEKTILPETPPIPKKEEVLKPKRKRRPKPKRVIMESPKKWENKWLKIGGKMVLFEPSGFEIMTKKGWRPLMMRADKIQK